MEASATASSTAAAPESTDGGAGGKAFTFKSSSPPKPSAAMPAQAAESKSITSAKVDVSSSGHRQASAPIPIPGKNSNPAAAAGSPASGGPINALSSSSGDNKHPRAPVAASPDSGHVMSAGPPAAAASSTNSSTPVRNARGGSGAHQAPQQWRVAANQTSSSSAAAAATVPQQQVSAPSHPVTILQREPDRSAASQPTSVTAAGARKPVTRSAVAPGSSTSSGGGGGGGPAADSARKPAGRTQWRPKEDPRGKDGDVRSPKVSSDGGGESSENSDGWVEVPVKKPTKRSVAGRAAGSATVADYEAIAGPEMAAVAARAKWMSFVTSEIHVFFPVFHTRPGSPSPNLNSLWRVTISNCLPEKESCVHISEQINFSSFLSSFQNTPTCHFKCSQTSLSTRGIAVTSSVDSAKRRLNIYCSFNLSKVLPRASSCFFF